MEYQDIAYFSRLRYCMDYIPSITFMIWIIYLSILYIVAATDKDGSVGNYRQYRITQGDTLYGIDIYNLMINLSKIS